jgi:hypothetical protein
VVRSCEHDNEPSGSIKGGEFLEQLSDCHILNKDSSVRLGKWRLKRTRGNCGK